MAKNLKIAFNFLFYCSLVIKFESLTVKLIGNSSQCNVFQYAQQLTRTTLKLKNAVITHVKIKRILLFT